ncbi:hypothetical protein ACRJ4B_46600 [Streptomyces sp. GTA36]|uniref:hypothetical protein n=1 Tax=Streptomyces umbrinus TaxID=67370 RepID=UPI0033F6791A
MQSNKQEPTIERLERRRTARSWGRTVRLWMPVVATTVTTAVAAYEAWLGRGA